MSFALQGSCILPRTTELSVYEMAWALADELLFGSTSWWRHPFFRHLTFPSLSTNYCFSVSLTCSSFLVPCSLSFFLGFFRSERRGSYLCSYRLESLLAFSVFPVRFFWLLNFLSHVCPTFSLTPTWSLYSFTPTFLNKGAPIPSSFDFTLPYFHLDTFDSV